MNLQINRNTFGKDIVAGLTAAVAGIPDGMTSATLANIWSRNIEASQGCQFQFEGKLPKCKEPKWYRKFT